MAFLRPGAGYSAQQALAPHVEASGTRLGPSAASVHPYGGDRGAFLGAFRSLRATPAQGSLEMTLFYRGPGALITHEVFVSRRPSYRQFAVRELKQVHVHRESAWEAIGSSTPVRVFSVGFGAIAAVVAVSGYPLLHMAAVSVVALIVLAVAGIAAAVARNLRSRPRGIWAVYRGQLTCIFETTDPAELGQVVRATVRVLERAGDGRDRQRADARILSARGLSERD